MPDLKDGESVEMQGSGTGMPASQQFPYQVSCQARVRRRRSMVAPLPKSCESHKLRGGRSSVWWAFMGQGEPAEVGQAVAGSGARRRGRGQQG